MSDLLVKHEINKHRNKVARKRHRQTLAQKQQHHEQALHASDAQHRRQVGLQNEINSGIQASNKKLENLSSDITDFNNIKAYNNVYVDSREFRLNSVFNSIRAITDCLIDHETFIHRSYVGSSLEGFQSIVGSYPVRFKELAFLIGTPKWQLLVNKYQQVTGYPREHIELLQYFVTLYLTYIFLMGNEELNINAIKSISLRFLYTDRVITSDVNRLVNWFALNEKYLADASTQLPSEVMEFIKYRLDLAGITFPYPDFDLTIANPEPCLEPSTEVRLRNRSTSNQELVTKALDSLIGG